MKSAVHTERQALKASHLRQPITSIDSVKTVEEALRMVGLELHGEPGVI